MTNFLRRSWKIQGVFCQRVSGHVYDVATVNSIEYRKRWFCITDSHLPCELSIEYDDPHTETSHQTIYVNGRVSSFPVTRTELYRTDTFRTTESECVRIIKDVIRKEAKLPARYKS